MRLVVGRWARSPFGEFTDVMLAEPDGRRILLAPSQDVAGFVASTYTFDEVVTATVAVQDAGPWWLVTAPGLDLRFRVGRRRPLGHLLRAVPDPIATAPAFCALTDPLARLVMRGVRTRGTAGNGRREFYGATDLHAVAAASGTWRGSALGDLAAVRPDPRFGFGSTPRQPSVTSVVTTVIW